MSVRSGAEGPDTEDGSPKVSQESSCAHHGHYVQAIEVPAPLDLIRQSGLTCISYRVELGADAPYKETVRATLGHEFSAFFFSLISRNI